MLKIIIPFMGSFDPLLKLFKPFLEDAGTFLQVVAVLVCGVMVCYYKIKSMFADVQQDQMFDAKAKATLVGLVVVFLAVPMINVLTSYFAK